MSHPQSVRIDEAVRERSLTAGLSAMFWSATMVGFGEASFALFAAHILAPDSYFGLLAGIPNLLGPYVQVLGANIVERDKRRRFLVRIGVMTQCLIFLPLAALALIGGNSLAQKLFLPLVIVYFAAGNLGGPAWNSLISDLCPSARRNHYFARNARNCGIMSLTGKVVLFCTVCMAGYHSTPNEKFDRMSLVFFSMYLIASGARLISFRSVGRMHEPHYDPPADASFTFWQFIRRARESNFVKFVIFVAVFYFGAFISAPFYLPNVIKALHHEPWEWVVIDSSSALCSVLTFLYWGRFSARFGNRATLALTSTLLSLVPILWICVDHLLWFVMCQSLAGALWAGFTLSCTNYIMEAVSSTKRARCFAYFSIFLGMGSFFGAMVGAALLSLPATLSVAGHTLVMASSYTYVFLFSFVFRVIGSVFFVKIFRELRVVQPFSLRTWAVEMAAVRFPLGLRLGWSNENQEGDDESEAREKKEPAGSGRLN